MRILGKKEDGGWDVSGTTSCGCLRDFCELCGKVEHVHSSLRWMPTQKGAGHIYFYSSAKAHSPDVLLPICSHGLGLERGWSCTAKSPCIQKKCHVTCNRSQSSSYLWGCSAELMAKRLAPATFHVTKTSRTCPLSPRFKKGKDPTVQSVSTTIPPKAYATAPATGIVALRSVS